jgi:hypothetical protein
MAQSYITFDEIFAGATARLAVIQNMQYLSVRDMIMHFGGKTAGAANKTWERLSDERKEEVATECRSFKFPGQGQTEQTVITFKGALKLVMWVGGENAKKYRSAMVSILQRYYAGDGSLMDEVEVNAQSAGPVQQMAQASLAVEKIAEGKLGLGKKREREDLLFEMEIDERKQRLAESKLAHASKLIEHANAAMGAINALKDWAHVDERTKLQMEDYIKNVVFNSMPTKTPALTLTNGDQPAPSSTSAINISIVAKELGMNLTDAQIQRAGREMAKKYRETYRCDPPKHKQYVGGNYIPVNSYMERDRVMMEQAIREAV